MILNYEGYHKCPSKCDVEIVKNEYRALVIFTELEDNPGTSITNFSENLAQIVKAQCLPGIHERSVMWFEHYPPGRLHEESYDEVKYIVWEGKYSSPTWRPSSKEEVNKIMEDIKDGK